MSFEENGFPGDSIIEMYLRNVGLRSQKDISSQNSFKISIMHPVEVEYDKTFYEGGFTSPVIVC